MKNKKVYLLELSQFTNPEKEAVACINYHITSNLTEEELSIFYLIKSLGRVNCRILSEDANALDVEYKELSSDDFKLEVDSLFKKYNKEKKLLEKLNQSLNNSSFIRNAPSSVIEKYRSNYTQSEEYLKVLYELCLLCIDKTLNSVSSNLDSLNLEMIKHEQ